LTKDFESALLVTDETEGCLQRSIKQGDRKLSIPHTAAQIDFDGDCLSDLFLTIVDSSTGKTYYEIFLRREKEVNNQDDETNNSVADNFLKGLNSFCLVSREEVPAHTSNLFAFADIDRDAMVDMLFITRNDLSLNVYYNHLLNN
jgi:hypothetical protein